MSIDRFTLRMAIDPRPAGTRPTPPQLQRIFSPRLYNRISGRVFLNPKRVLIGSGFIEKPKSDPKLKQKKKKKKSDPKPLSESSPI